MIKGIEYFGKREVEVSVARQIRSSSRAKLRKMLRNDLLTKDERVVVYNTLRKT